MPKDEKKLIRKHKPMTKEEVKRLFKNRKIDHFEKFLTHVRNVRMGYMAYISECRIVEEAIKKYIKFLESEKA